MSDPGTAEKPRRRSPPRRGLVIGINQRLPPIKVFHEDLVALGIVRSRTHQFDLIRAGRLRPPHKDGHHAQSRAWWFYSDILEDAAREKARLEGRSPT